MWFKERKSKKVKINEKRYEQLILVMGEKEATLLIKTCVRQNGACWDCYNMDEFIRDSAIEQNHKIDELVSNGEDKELLGNKYPMAEVEEQYQKAIAEKKQRKPDVRCKYFDLGETCRKKYDLDYKPKSLAYVLTGEK